MQARNHAIQQRLLFVGFFFLSRTSFSVLWELWETPHINTVRATVPIGAGRCLTSEPIKPLNLGTLEPLKHANSQKVKVYTSSSTILMTKDVWLRESLAAE